MRPPKLSLILVILERSRAINAVLVEEYLETGSLADMEKACEAIAVDLVIGTNKRLSQRLAKKLAVLDFEFEFME